MDKNKIIEVAAKLVAKGAYDKAIKEYQRALEADPKDVRILQKMGELYQKKNDNVNAAVYLTKVAESYSSDGFSLKAIALYKQVLKLNPDLMDVNMKLAELHQQLQLMSEAMTYYQVVANAYDKAGDTKKSLEILKKMVDLDPDNVASREKLGQLFARENMNADALPEFKRAAEYYKKNSRSDDYLRVAERIATLEPDNLELSRELASAYLSKGDQKRALARLQACFKAEPKDVQTLTLLAQAFDGLGQSAKTLSVYKELAKVYQEQGKAADAREVWAKVERLDASDPELLQYKGAGAPASSAAPSRPAAAGSPPPPPMAQPPAAPPPMGKEHLGKLLTETDVYVKYGLHDKALDHLRKVFAIDPEHLDAHEKAYKIYEESGSPQAPEQLLNVLRLCTRNNEVDRGQAYLNALLSQNPDHPEVPAFLAVLRPGGELPVGEPAADEAILVDSQEEEVIVSEAPEDALLRSPEEVASAIEDEPLNDEALAVAVDDDGSGEVIDDEALAAASAAMDEPLGASEQEITAETSAEFEEDYEPVSEIDLSPPEVEAPPPPPPPKAAPSPPAPKAVAPPPKTPPPAAKPPAAKAAPPKPAAKPAPVKATPEKPAPAAKGAAPAKPATTAKPVAKPAAAPKAAPKPAAAAKKPAVDPVATELDEADFFLDQNMLEEARDIIDNILIAYPEHKKALELRRRLDAKTEPAAAANDEGKDAFDLAAELAGELGDEGDAGAALGPGPGDDDFQYSVEEVFAEFKKGLAKVVKPEDVDTHYDLGIAYKEMGMVDEAISEFKVARQGCLNKKKEVDCLTMLGLLYAQKGEHDGAVEAFMHALQSDHATPEASKALMYELGLTREAMGEPGKALYHFQKVAKSDPKYRDVAALVGRLSAETQAKSDPLPARAAMTNGANGVHGKSPSKGTGEAAAKATPEPGAPKGRKVGYV